MGTQLPQRGTSPKFSAHVCCGQTAGWIKMPLSTEVGLGPVDNVFDGDPAPPPQKRGQAAPTFRPMYCRQTAGWIKMLLGTEVGLGPGHIVLDGDPAHLRKGYSSPPNFWPKFLVAKWLDGSRCHLVRRYARTRPHCVRWGPSPPSPRKGEQPPNF